MNQYHIAQMNIAKAKDAMYSEVMQGFVNRLDEINQLADGAAGFIWRLQTEEGDATSIQAFDDPSIIVNLSVWDSIESLKQFVYKTVHVELIRERKSWFEKIETAHQVLWWIPAGHIPTVNEGKEKLELLQSRGASQESFTFAESYGCSE